MNTKTLNSDNFAGETSEGKILVDFWADWCQPCHMMAPVLDSVASKGLPVGKVELDGSDGANALIEKFQIQSIPTMILFKDGVPVKRVIGAMDERDLYVELSEHLD